MKSNERVKDSINGHTKDIAAKLGLSPESLYKWMDSNPKYNNPVKAVLRLYEATDDVRIIEYICNKSGGFFVRNTDDMNTKAHINKIYSEMADVIKAIADGWEDEYLTKNELWKIQVEFSELQSCLTGFLNEQFKKFVIEEE